MTTLQMEYFLSLAERLNFTAVAERFFIAQPTLSRQIANIEQELHTQLFIRDKNSVRLTPAGKELYTGLKTIVPQYTALIRRVEQTANSPAGKLSIGLSEEQIMSEELSQALAEFHRRYPNVAITIRKGNFKELRVGLVERYFDVVNALYMTGGFLNELHYTVISQDAACLACSLKAAAGFAPVLTQEAAANLLDRNTLILADSESFVTPEDNPFEGCRALLGFRPPSIRFEGNLSSIPAYVESNLGITLVNESHILSTDPYAVLLRLEHATPYQKILAYPPHTNNSLVEEFIALVQAQIEAKRGHDTV